MDRPRLNFWQIWNMCFGFFGIQFGWNLQLSNMSSIYEYLGAEPDKIPILWLAAPLTGLLVQPIVGHFSDRTWGSLGRRRPYFLVGALLSSAALLAMPNAGSLWMAAGLLWVLDASINVSMEPFRAFVADMLPEEQRTQGFVMQSFLIGMAAIASCLPWVLTNVFHLTRATGTNGVPATVRWSFYIGSFAVLAAVLWTVLRTPEYPPEDLAEFRRQQAATAGFWRNIGEVWDSLLAMPATMKQLAWAQVFTWLGLFSMWNFFPVAVARNVLGATDTHTALYAEGIEWGGFCFAAKDLVCFALALSLPVLARRYGRVNVHTLCLLCGAMGLLSVAAIHNKYLLLLSMAGVGIAWASILSMPYAILAGALPQQKIGTYMGVFNFFIVIPEILASLCFGWLMRNVLENNRLAAVVMGGVFLLIAALLMQRVQDPAATILEEEEEYLPSRSLVALPGSLVDPATTAGEAR